MYYGDGNEFPWVEDIYIEVVLWGEARRPRDGSPIPKRWHMSRPILSKDIPSLLCSHHKMCGCGQILGGVGKRRWREINPDNHIRKWRREMNKKRHVTKILDIFDMNINLDIAPNYMREGSSLYKQVLKLITPPIVAKYPDIYNAIRADTSKDCRGNIKISVPVTRETLYTAINLYLTIHSSMACNIEIMPIYESTYPKAYATGEAPMRYDKLSSSYVPYSKEEMDAISDACYKDPKAIEAYLDLHRVKAL